MELIKIIIILLCDSCYYKPQYGNAVTLPKEDENNNNNSNEWTNTSSLSNISNNNDESIQLR